MTSRIQVAIKNEGLVTLADVRRGEQGLTCHTCGDKLVVKDGGGQFVNGKGRRNQRRGKHFSHTAKSKCHGEGLAHYLIKTALCGAINQALEMSREDRNAHGRISYLCPDPDYGPNDVFKWAPGSDGLTRQFEEMQHGYHCYDLFHGTEGYPIKDIPALDRAECEVWLGNGRRTRADIAGLTRDGKALWVIEIDRSGVSKAAKDHASENAIPLFIVDLTHLPQPTVDDPMAEIKCWDFFVLYENLSRGFYPSVTESLNTECERKAFGMGPTDLIWSKEYAYVHRGTGDCNNDRCPDCVEVLLHECGEFICPDTYYMFNHGIDRFQMYTDPVHKTNSHLKPSES